MVEYVSSAQADESNDLDSTFGALSDPTRRKIIALLREANDLKVTDLAKSFSISLNGVSKHIKVLERAGLVLRRIDGRDHWLSVNWAALQCASEWLDSHRHFWETRLDALADYAETETKSKGNRS